MEGFERRTLGRGLGAVSVFAVCFGTRVPVMAYRCMVACVCVCVHLSHHLGFKLMLSPDKRLWASFLLKDDKIFPTS